MKFFKYFFLVFFIGLLSVLIYFLYLIAPTSFSDDKITFVVPLDAKQDEVIFRLQGQGFIRSPQLFGFIAGFYKLTGKIEPGSYQISHRMSTLRIANILMLHPYQLWITLVPGLRKEQVAERLAKKFYWEELKLNEFNTAAKEGYLYPDTYLLNLDYSGADFANRLMNNFNDHLTPQMQKELLSQNIRIDTAVKIASLIERESGSDEDKPIIAGIIWNRLDKKMRLQLDAANQYVVGKSGDWWPTVHPSDLKIDSPYNLYQTTGLPPGPICSPSLASIQAVIDPTPTDCLYYLHDRAKQIHCAITYQKHLQNIETYLNL